MPDTLADISFDLPFEEAVAAFLDKQVMPRAEFEALALEMRGRAFTAAWVYAADELQRLHGAVLAAIEKGETLREFTDKVGDILGKAWHRETVFRTNVLHAYGKGHWDQAQDTRSQRPYARYSAVMDGRTRPHHAVLHGMVYPLDHPFWKSYWPPWDYNCRCAALTFSQEEVTQQNLDVRQGWEGVPPPNDKFASPAAGEKFSPDYGKYAPELGQALREKVETLYD